MSNYNNENIEMHLNSRYHFQYNTVNNKLYIKHKSESEFRVLESYHLNSLLRELRASLGKKITKMDLVEILSSDFTPTFNPFKDYFESLPKWDGTTDYIAQLADSVQVDPADRALWHKWLTKWLTASVATILDPIAINHQVLVLSGGQGIGKSTFLRNLMPKALDAYYYGGSINLGNKDTEIQLTENLIINFDEFESLSKRDIHALKEIITKRDVKLRRPYGATVELMKRHASFVASVNNPEFLVDKTGNRRYLTVRAISINYNHGINMDDVFAQALALYESDFEYWMSPADIAEIEAHNSQYINVPLEQEILEKHFNPCLGSQVPDFELETEDLIAFLYENSKLASRISAHKLGSVLHSLNWPKRKTKGRRYWLLMKA